MGDMFDDCMNELTTEIFTHHRPTGRGRGERVMTQWFWESRPGDKTATTHTTNIPIVTDPHPRPRPTRAQATAAVEELYAAAFEIGRLDNTIQLARNRDVTEKLSGRINQLRYEVKQAKQAIIEALTPEDES